MDTKYCLIQCKHSSINLLIIFNLLFIWVLFGSYPFGPYEADGTTISYGIHFLEKTSQDNQLSLQEAGKKGVIYRYDVQAGSYRISQLIHSIFGNSYYSAFSIATLLSFLVFLGSGATYLARTTETSVCMAGILLLLFPEVMAVVGYPNTSIIGFAFIALSMLFAAKPGIMASVLSIAMFATAVWCRFDAILLSPYVGFLLLVKSYKKKRWLTSIVLASTFLLIVASLFYFSGVCIENIFKATLHHSSHWADKELTIANYIAFYPLFLSILAVFGVVVSVMKKNVKHLTLFLLGVVPVFTSYGWGVTTGKYLIYTVIPFSIMTLMGLDWILSRKNRTKTILLVLLTIVFIYEYIPFGFPAYHAPAWSNDGPRPVIGLLRTPFDVHKTKFRKGRAFNEVANFLLEKARAEKSPFVIAVRDNHEISAHLLSELISRDGILEFSYIENSKNGQVFTFETEGQKVEFIAFYSGGPFPPSIVNGPERNIAMVYWRKWPPKISLEAHREVIFENKMLTVEDIKPGNGSQVGR